MNIKVLDSKDFLNNYESCYFSDHLSGILEGKDDEINETLDNWLDEKVSFDSRTAPKASWQLNEFKGHLGKLLEKFSKKNLLVEDYGLGEMQCIPIVLLAEHLKLLKIKKILHEPLPEQYFERDYPNYVGFIVDVLPTSNTPPTKRTKKQCKNYYDLVIDEDWDFIWSKNNKKKWKLKTNNEKFYKGAERFKEMFDNQGKAIYSQSDWKSFTDTAAKNTGLDKETLESYKIIEKGKYGLKKYQ